MLKKDEINFFIVRVLNLPNTLQISINDLNALIFPKKRYRIDGVYGYGEYGLILRVKSNFDNETYAIKLAKASAYSLKEFDIQKTFANYNMAPKLYLYDITEGTIKGFNVVFTRAVMDPITTTLFQYLRSGKSRKKLFYPIECLMKKKYLLGLPNPYLHGDMHCNNIVILKDGRTLGLIDFAWTTRKAPMLQILDCIPLITSCLNVPNTRDLCLYMIEMYKRMFNIKLDIKNFTTLQGGGYAYNRDGYLLHSYDWTATKNRSSLPTVSIIKQLFPMIKVPKVT